MTCRRCADCPDSTHHWLDNPDFGNDDPLAGVASYLIEATHVCKHCPAYGNECEACDGTGEDDVRGGNCRACDGEGVKEVPRLASLPFHDLKISAKSVTAYPLTRGTGAV